MSDHETVSKRLNKSIEELNLYADPDDLSQRENIGDKRRRKNRRRSSKIGALAVVEQSGVYRLSDAPPVSQHSSGRRRSSHRGSRVMGNVVEQQEIKLLPHAQIPGAIAKLDNRLTPDRGLRKVKNGRIVGNGSDVTPIEKGKILLFIHGTFSKSEAFFEQINRRGFKEGREFMAWANKKYQQILTFDHPTLAVSPLINARELALMLNHSNADIDVVCHSRGGLVTRWWLEAFDRGTGNRRVVFVGSPLNGTGLAAPPNIRNAMNMSFTIGTSMSTATAAIPFLNFATGLFQVVSSITRIAAKTPLVDSLVAMVPGLVAQSRVQNNFERLSLRKNSFADYKTNYYAIVSNFESEKASWQFWQNFRKKNLMDKGADLIFDGPNDLVVDTASMIDLQDHINLPDENIHNFGTTDRVHHTNYFKQKETLQFIMQRLQ